MVVALLVFLCAIWIVSFLLARDLLSPSKFYLLCLTAYFLDIFLKPQLGMVYVAYFFYELIGLVFVLVEKRYVGQLFETGTQAVLTRQRPALLSEKRLVKYFWLMSLIPVMAQLFFVFQWGSLGNYFLAVSHRELAWRGFGPLFVIFRMLPVINLIFFIMGVLHFKDSKRWWVSYALHLLLVLVFSSLLGSRGNLLHSLIFAIVVYHFLWRPLKLKTCLLMTVFFLSAVVILGGVREGFRVYNQEGVQSFTKHVGSISPEGIGTFKYGLIPLQIIFSRPFDDLQYGSTYIAPFTDLIPRRIWPSKPPGGGAVLTAFSQGVEYDGSTSISTGVITEGILNFGYTIGFSFALFELVVVILLSMVFYRRLLLARLKLSEHSSTRQLVTVLLYVFIFGLPGNIIFAEFASTVDNLIFWWLNCAVVMYFMRPYARCEEPTYNRQQLSESPG